MPLFEKDADGNDRADRYWSDGFLVIDHVARRGYQFFSDNSSFPPSTVIWSFDLDRLTPISRVELGDFRLIKMGNPNSPGEAVSAIDARGERLLLAGLTGTSTPVGSNQTVLSPAIAVIDHAKFDDAGLEGSCFKGSDPSACPVTSMLRIPASQAAQLTGRDLYGMTVWEDGDATKLLMLFSSPPPGVSRRVQDHWLVQWDVDTGAGDWAELLQACSAATLVPTSSEWKYQLAILRGASTISIGCSVAHGLGQAVQIPLDTSGKPDPAGTVRTFPIPRTIVNVLADPESERLIFMAELSGTTWWVFDAQAGAWVGAVGAALWTGYPIAGGLDPFTGRLYTLVPNHTRLTDPPQPVIGGLQWSDTRLTPTPQSSNFEPLNYPGQFRIVVDPADPETGRQRRVFVRRGSSLNNLINGEPAPLETFYLVLEDTTPITPLPRVGDLDRNTIDQPEEQGSTGSNFDASGSGYGVRTLLVGGASAAVDRSLDSPSGQCGRNDREVVAAAVQRVAVSNLQASAGASSVYADQATRADYSQPLTRCDPTAVTHLIPESLRSQVDGNAGSWGEYSAECAGDDESTTSPGLPVADARATASCAFAGLSASAESSARFGPSASPIRVAGSHTTVTTRRDPSRGVVSTVVAEARGIEVVGVGSIDLVRTVAESWAGGRPGTAATKFTRVVCGVRLPGFVREPCGDPEAAALALRSALGRSGDVRLREPDRSYAKGSPGGYLSAIQRDRGQSFSDETVTRDSSKAVPGLEIILYRNDSPSEGAGRQVFQFAGVQASAAYGIYCLRGEHLDAKGKRVCNEPPKPDPANLKIKLTDASEPPQPLAGGLFKVHEDADGDGILGEADRLLTGGTCVTGPDGIGDCSFTGLEPGEYIIEEAKAPPGYQAVEPFAVTLESASTTEVKFTNLEAIGIIALRLFDDTPEAKPLAGGVFTVFADNGDGEVGATDLRYASCTTDAGGNCKMQLEPDVVSVVPDGEPPVLCLEASGVCFLAVPLGPYVVSETKAPEGYQPSNDVAFTLARPGDLALIRFVNGLAPVPATDGEPPVEREPEVVVVEEPVPPTPDIPPTPAVPPTEQLIVEPGVSNPVPIVSKSEPPAPSVVRQVIEAPARIIEKGVEGMRLLLSSPRELGLIAAVWSLVWAPCYLAERRRLAARLIASPKPAGSS